MRKYDSYKDSGVEWIGEIPSHWDLKTNKYFTQSQKNKSEKGEEELLSVSEYHGVIPRRNIRESEEHLSRSESLEGYLKVRKGELVSNIMLMWKRGLGVSEFEGIVSPSYSVFSFLNSEPKYFHYLFRTDHYVSEFRRNSTGVIESRLRLYDDSFGSLKSHYPPLSEQQQIVSYLDTKTSLIDSLIEKTQLKIQLLKENRTSLINEVVTKGLNPNVEMKDSGVEWIGEIPSHWECLRLKYFVNFDSGFSFKSDDYCDEGIPLIRIGSLYNNILSLDRSPIFLPKEYKSEFQQFVVKKDDILVSMTGTLGKRDYGYSILYNEEFPSLLNQRVGRIRISSDKINLQFLMYNLLSESFLLQLFSKPTGTKQGNLSSDDIIGNYFGYPPLSEQNEIISYLDEHTQLIDKTISVEERRIELLKEYRQSLISEVVTGKRKVVTHE